MFKISIKSGTCGHSDCGNCDLIVAEVPSTNIPNVGDIVEILCVKYLVSEVRRVYNLPPVTFGEWIYVYVIKI